MDIKPIAAAPTAEERDAIDVLLGPPMSGWEGGDRSARDAHVAFGVRPGRQMLLPALEALQARAGWISEGGLGYVCDRLDVPPADAWGVATFYALLATTPRPRCVVHVCDDIACRIRGARAIVEQLESASPAIAHGPEGEHVIVDRDAVSWMHSPCLGLCDMAPAALVIEAGNPARELSLGGITNDILGDAKLSRVDAAASPPFPQQGDSALSLLKRVGMVDPRDFPAYQSTGGFTALKKALEMGAERVIREVADAKLVGRGGAAFPTSRKWEAVRVQGNTPHYLICNADESEPGTFKDRLLMTHDPFAIVESMTIAAYAAGCERGFLYLRAEYPLAFERMANAIVESRNAGMLGTDILGSGFSFDIEIRRGAGAYICGEETAIFESIEGKRGEPRNKPPFPAQYGLFGKPTVVNNVETLANVLPIILRGGQEYAKTGTEQSTGTRLFCLSGAVQKPGVYEVACGITLRGLLEIAGGVPENLQAILLGGAAGNFIRADEIDLRLTIEDTRAAGVTLGSGVVMAFDTTADMHDIVHRIAAFFRDESCGQCVPCRVGTVRQEESLHRIASRKMRGGLASELGLLEEIGQGMKDGSICGLGQTAYAAVESAIKRLRLYEA
jgi:NADH-quinone oxidoreductase subunit F